MSLRRRLGTVVAALLIAAGTAACSGLGDTAPPGHRTTHSPDAFWERTAARPLPHEPLRPGERLVRLAMPEPYTPSAPYGHGTDDYHCFVLDPKLGSDAFITGMNIAPGARAIVHHVILFRVPPSAVPAVEAKDAAQKGEGWTCFGGTGVQDADITGGGLDDAPWLGAWAPGGGEQVLAKDVGVPLRKGSRVIMQVHYNLIPGPRPDVTSAVLRLAPGNKRLAALHTMLLPAPVELPCRPGHDSGALCDRSAAVSDAQARFGSEIGEFADYVHFLCGPVHPGPVQSCQRTMRGPATIRAAAGHMHLLGRSIKVQVDPGTPHARTVLDIRNWDFDNQAAKPVKPVRLHRGDTVRVTCRHTQRLRDLLPAFRGQQEKYVVWGEGTTDEMCLGMLLVTRP